MSLNRRSDRICRFGHRGAVALLLAVMLPVLIGFGTLATDAAYLYYRNILLRQTVEASALAAANHLSDYYASGGPAAVVSAAQDFAAANDPSGHFGKVVPSTNVVIGNWDSSTSTFTSLASGGGSTPNAVQVTGVYTTANGNPVGLFFGGYLGIPTNDLSVTAIATSTSSQPFHTIMVNDLSTAFAAQITDQQATDIATLDCLTNSTHPQTRFGVAGFTAHGVTHSHLLPAQANYHAHLAQIKKMAPCTAGAAVCGGSNVAAGIYAAIQEFTGASLGGQHKNIVIVTDSLPSAGAGVTYATADGIYPTPGSAVPVCTTGCTDADLLTMAQNQAAVAKSAGISVSTIYYTGNTPATLQSYYASALATLRQGVGQSFTAATTADIDAAFNAVCATMPSSLALIK